MKTGILAHIWTGIIKILFERIAFQIRNPRAEMDCIPTSNPFFTWDCKSNPQSFLQSSLWCPLVDPVRGWGRQWALPNPQSEAWKALLPSSSKSRIESHSPPPPWSPASPIVRGSKVQLSAPTRNHGKRRYLANQVQNNNICDPPSYILDHPACPVHLFKLAT